MPELLSFQLCSDSVCVIVLIVLSAAAVAIAVLSVRRERRQGAVEKPGKDAETPPPTPVGTRSFSIREVVEDITDEGIRELIRDRMEEVLRRTEDWGMEVADVLGEIENLKTEPGGDTERVRELCIEMRRELAATGCELLDSDVWTPEIQRAIKVENAPSPGGQTSVTHKISYGLRVHGRLVRKQEVCIQKEQNDYIP